VVAIRDPSSLNRIQSKVLWIKRHVTVRWRRSSCTATRGLFRTDPSNEERFRVAASVPWWGLGLLLLGLLLPLRFCRFAGLYDGCNRCNFIYRLQVNAELHRLGSGCSSREDIGEYRQSVKKPSEESFAARIRQVYRVVSNIRIA